MERTLAESWRKHIPVDIQMRYEIIDRRHAAAILATEFTSQFKEICEALRSFCFTDAQIKQKGGSESEIPKSFSKILRPYPQDEDHPANWRVQKLTPKLIVRDEETGEEAIVSSDSHWIDYVKGRVATESEWNSKDQTFDRDLFAFRSFFDFGRIDLGILVRPAVG